MRISISPYTTQHSFANLGRRACPGHAQQCLPTAHHGLLFRAVTVEETGTGDERGDACGVLLNLQLKAQAQQNVKTGEELELRGEVEGRAWNFSIG